MGVCVDKDTRELSFGPMRTCAATDAYGNKVIFSTEGLVMGLDATHPQVRLFLLRCHLRQRLRGTAWKHSLLVCFHVRQVYADAQALHDIKMASVRDRQAKAIEKAEKKKMAKRKAKKAAAGKVEVEDADEGMAA